jgi:hypothetical protein
MSVPVGVKFDRFAQLSDGLVAFGLGLPVHANGIALVTGFLFGEIWLPCFDAITTSWSVCAAPVSTTWTDNNPSVTTTWELVE